MSTEFNAEQFTKAYPARVQDSFWNIARNRVILYYVKKFKLKGILDVGCGRGVVTFSLAEAGIDITGVDPGNPPLDENPKCTIYYNTEVKDLPEEVRNRTEAIALFDVLEHIERPVEFLRGLHSLFPRLQYLIITVPARQELWSNFDDFYGHFRRYTLASLKKEMKQTAFRVVFSRYFFHLLYPLIGLNNIFRHNRNVEVKAPNGFVSRTMHKVLGAIFFMELPLVPQLVPGSSIIAVCRRRI